MHYYHHSVCETNVENYAATVYTGAGGSIHQINGPRSDSHACNGKCALKPNVDEYNVSSKSNPNRLRGKLYLLSLVNTQNHLTSRFADYNLILAYMTPRETVYGKAT